MSPLLLPQDRHQPTRARTHTHTYTQAGAGLLAAVREAGLVLGPGAELLPCAPAHAPRDGSVAPPPPCWTRSCPLLDSLMCRREEEGRRRVGDP